MIKVNFGCGISVAPGWINYDSSPTLRLQRVPMFGHFMKKLTRPRFPELARFGDIVRGLPEPDESLHLVYCSHVLEHLSLHDFRAALSEVMRVLMPGGVFRGVLPDLEQECRNFIENPSADACSLFMHTTCLGQESRPRGLVRRVRAVMGNSQHLWMWDYKGLEMELRTAGFAGIRRAEFNDSEITDFLEIEDKGRWDGCLGFECKKPEHTS